jgi:hypothetical protein
MTQDLTLLNAAALQQAYARGLCDPVAVTRAHLARIAKRNLALHAFVHVSLPDDILVDIEENKHQCQDCGRLYYSEQIRDDEYGIFIDSFMPPKDGHCVDCGSSNITNGSDPISFERDLEAYKKSKDSLLSFYDHYGILVDFELKKGFEDYDTLKRKIQMNIKH